MQQPDPIEAGILALTGAKPGGSVSPTDVARHLQPEQWRPLLAPVRLAALRLQQQGRIEILRKGKPVPPESVRGVIRLRVCGA